MCDMNVDDVKKHFVCASSVLLVFVMCICVCETENSPTVGVLLVLKEVFELREEELSARARGAAGGGLELDILEGLNGRPCRKQLTD